MQYRLEGGAQRSSTKAASLLIPWAEQSRRRLASLYERRVQEEDFRLQEGHSFLIMSFDLGQRELIPFNKWSWPIIFLTEVWDEFVDQ